MTSPRRFAFLDTEQHAAPDMTHAAAMGIGAGLDMEGGGTAAIDALPDAIRRGLTNAAAVAEAFKRVMRVRLRLGMLDPPRLVPWNFHRRDDAKDAATQKLNRLAAVSGIVMLQNRHDLLPLDVKHFQTPSSLLVAGPLADDGHKSALKSKAPWTIHVTASIRPSTGHNALGSYSCGTWDCALNVTTPFGGLRYAGTGLDRGQIRHLPLKSCASTECRVAGPDLKGLAAAARTARAAILAIGKQVVCGHEHYEKCRKTVKDADAFEQEGHDRQTVSLGSGQLALARAVSETKTPLVCVLYWGLCRDKRGSRRRRGYCVEICEHRAHAAVTACINCEPSAMWLRPRRDPHLRYHGGGIGMGELLSLCDAVLDAFFPGQQGGAALADVIFGRVSPAGRLP